MQKNERLFQMLSEYLSLPAKLFILFLYFLPQRAIEVRDFIPHRTRNIRTFLTLNTPARPIHFYHFFALL